MQRDREVRENSNNSDSPFNSFGGFGFGGSMFPSIFGGKDPFFSRPYGSMFGSDTSSNDAGQLHQTGKLKGPVIKELDSDAEEVLDEEEEDGASWSNKNPLVEHPEDQDKDNGKCTNNRREVSSHTANYDKAERSQPQTHSVSFQRVTYGGINGAYYSATTSRRTGSDGVTLEESKQADRTTGQATHRVSRGIQDKGHSVTRKLDSEGKVDTTQTLHNLNEDELAGFEQVWGDRRLGGWNDTFDFPGFSGTGGSRLGPLAWGRFSDPFTELSERSRGRSFDQNLHGQSSAGRPKKVVTINID